MTNDYPTKLEDLARDEGDRGPLVCHGCGHSAADAPWPGRPSGERPCHFCTRNVRREADITAARKDGVEHFAEGVYGKTWTAYYDNSPMQKCPMDCYISTDMIMGSAPDGSVVIT